MKVTGISPALRGTASTVSKSIAPVVTELAHGIETKAKITHSNSDVTAALKGALGIKSPRPKVDLATAEKTPSWKTLLEQDSKELSISYKGIPEEGPGYYPDACPVHEPDELPGHGEEQATTLYKAPRILTEEEASSQKAGSKEAGSDESQSCTDPNGECCHDFCCVSKHNPKRFTNKMNKFDKNCCSG